MKNDLQPYSIIPLLNSVLTLKWQYLSLRSDCPGPGWLQTLCLCKQAHEGRKMLRGETGDQALLEIPFPQQACLVLGPAEAHIKGAAVVLITPPPSVFLYVLLSFCVFTSSLLFPFIYMFLSPPRKEQLSGFILRKWSKSYDCAAQLQRCVRTSDWTAWIKPRLDASAHVLHRWEDIFRTCGQTCAQLMSKSEVKTPPPHHH